MFLECFYSPQNLREVSDSDSRFMFLGIRLFSVGSPEMFQCYFLNSCFEVRDCLIGVWEVCFPVLDPAYQSRGLVFELFVDVLSICLLRLLGDVFCLYSCCLWLFRW